MESTKFKKGKMVVILLVWITMGLYGVVGGPAMMDLRLLFHTNYKDISQALSGYGVGSVPGAIIGGVIVDMFATKKEAFLGISQLAAAACVALIPFSPSTGIVWFLFVMTGIFKSCVKISVMKIILEMWEEKVASAMFFSYMGFGIGAVLSPIILNPFLAVTSNAPQHDIGKRHLLEMDDKVEELDPGKESRVHLGFLVIALITVIVAIPMFYYQHKRTQFLKTSMYEIPRNPEHHSKPKTGGHMGTSKSVLVILVLYYFSVVGAETVFGNFVRTFSRDQLQFTRDQASYLNVLFWLSFSIGRLLASVISRFVPVRLVLLVHSVLHLVTSTIAGQYSPERQTTMWIFTAVQGLAFAPLYPSGLSFVNTKMELSGRGLMAIEIGGACGGTLSLLLAGWMYDVYGPHSVLSLLQTAGIAIIICANVLICVVRARRSA